MTDKLKSSLKFQDVETGFDKINKAIAKVTFSPMEKGIDSVYAKFTMMERFAIQAYDRMANKIINIGKKIADETQYFLPEGGSVYIISQSNDSNSNTLISGIQSALGDNQKITTRVIEKVGPDLAVEGKNNIFISLTEDATILSAQTLSEQYDPESYRLIGIGSNEVCQLYLQKDWIAELVSLDPEKIGETAIRELFEYRTKGYANSYITAEVKITKAPR
jgi:ribose transport system substrate-binding protein